MRQTRHNAMNSGPAITDPSKPSGINYLYISTLEET
jgi:hypothetical protein